MMKNEDGIVVENRIEYIKKELRIYFLYLLI
jgi:hypothetical protein